MNDQVILVDAADRAIGTADKLAAHRRNQRHRAISILIFDHAGRMLLQRRSAAKYHSAGQWSNACCSHPRVGETTQAAAERRLRDELGISTVLTFAGLATYQAAVGEGMFENEVVHVFTGRHDGPVAANPDEVQAVMWRDIGEIRADMKANPGRYTEWFKLYADEDWFADTRARVD